MQNSKSKIAGPNLWNSLDFTKNASLFAAENRAIYGDFFPLSLPFHSIYVVSDPDILQQILIRNEPNYIKSKIYWAQLRAVVGDALGTYEGEDFLWMKQLQMKAYTKEKAGLYLDRVIISGNRHFEEWAKNEGPVDIINAFSELNVATLLEVLFGVENSGLCDVIAHYIADGEETISWRSKFPWRPYLAWLNGRNQRYRSHVQFFNDFAEETIQKRLAKPGVDQLIDLLLRESTYLKDNGKIDPKIIRNEIIIHLGAGTETAAVGMGWTLYLLSKHPEILKKVREEIDEIIPDSILKPEHAYKLTYTNMVLKEVLRLYPPSHGIVRDAVKGDTLKSGVVVKPGDTFFISAYALHRNPRFWDRPDEFIPERFEAEPEKYSYIPFGAGKHTCIGRYLGQPMMTLALAELVMNYDFEVMINEPVTPISLSTLKPNQPILGHFKKRNKNLHFQNSNTIDNENPAS